ncbi:hypothetical protein MMC11_004495 [Xylographa trunciseda]|nr:hypothetical protein [Xylographa trunciseda]
MAIPAQGIASKSTLAGYDETFAISQNTINSTFRRLYRRGVITLELPSAFQNAVLHAPTIDLGGTPLILFQVHFQSGQYMGLDLTGWAFHFQVGITKDILATIPSSTTKTAPTTVEELTNRVGSSSAYSIIQISLQFDPKTIDISGSWNPSSSSLTTVSPGDQRAVDALSIIKGYFGGLSQNDHGYHLGYSVQTKQTPLPLFAPTMVDTDIRRFVSGPGTAATASGLNALLFQLQTLDKSPPADVRPNSFASNVITDNEHGGIFMISNGKFADEWVHNMIINGAILPSLGSRPTNSVFVKNTPTSWIFSESTSQTVVHKHQGTLKENVNEHTNQQRECSVKIIGLTNQIEISIDLAISRSSTWKLETTVFGTYEEIGSGSSIYKETITVTLYPNASQGFAVSTPVSVVSNPPPSMHLTKNGSKFLTFITGINSNALMSKDMKSWSTQVQAQMAHLSSALAMDFKAVAANILLPGVSSYSFSNLRLSPEAHVLIDVDYLDDDTPAVQSFLKQQQPLQQPQLPVQPSIPVPATTLPASQGPLFLTARSDLIEQRTTAQLIGRRNSFSTVTDCAGNPVVISISSSGHLELLRNDISNAKGWIVKEISPPGTALIQTAKAYQGQDGLIHLAAAISTSTGLTSLPSRLYVAAVDWSNLGAIDWSKVWLERPMPSSMGTATTIGQLLWGGATQMDPKPALLASSVGSKKPDGSSIFAEHYVIEVSPTVIDPGRIWTLIPMPLNSTEIRSMVLGVDAIGDKGLYSLFTNENVTELFFTGFADEFGKYSHEPISCRTGDQSLLAIPRADGKTTLFVAGSDGIFYYDVGCQSRGHDPLCITRSTDIEAPITELQGHVTGNYLSVWARDKASNLLHITGSASVGAPIDGSWCQILNFRAAVAAFTPVYNHQKGVDELLVLSNSQEESLTHVYRTSPTGTWVSLDISIPNDSTVLSSSTFTTIVKVVDVNGVPARGVKVNVTTAERHFIIANDMYLQVEDTPIPIVTDYRGTIKIVLPTTSLQAPSYVFQLTGSPDIPHDPTSKVTDALKQYNSLGNFKNAKAQDGSPVFSGSEDQAALSDTFDATQQIAAVKVALQVNASAGSSPTAAIPVRQAVNAGHKTIEGEFGDMIEHIKTTWDQVVHDIKTCKVTIENEVIKLSVRMGNVICNTSIRSWGQFCHFMTWAFNKVKQGIEELVTWLGFIFSWQDIVHTQQNMVRFINSLLALARCKISGLETTIDQKFQAIRDKINAKTLPPDINAEAIAKESPQSHLSPEQTQSKSTITDDPHMDWVHDNVKHASSHLSLHIDILPDLSKYFKAGLDKVLADLLAGAERAGADCSEASAALKELATQKNPSISKMLDVLGGTLCKVLLDGMQAFVDSILDIILVLLEMIQDILNHVIEIPLISDLYKTITGEQMASGMCRSNTMITALTISQTFLNMLTLFIAIPMTITCKLITGQRPFNKVDGGSHPWVGPMLKSASMQTALKLNTIMPPVKNAPIQAAKAAPQAQNAQFLVAEARIANLGADEMRAAKASAECSPQTVASVSKGPEAFLKVEAMPIQPAHIERSLTATAPHLTANVEPVAAATSLTSTPPSSDYPVGIPSDINNYSPGLAWGNTPDWTYSANAALIASCAFWDTSSALTLAGDSVPSQWIGLIFNWLGSFTNLFGSLPLYDASGWFNPPSPSTAPRWTENAEMYWTGEIFWVIGGGVLWVKDCIGLGITQFGGAATIETFKKVDAFTTFGCMIAIMAGDVAYMMGDIPGENGIRQDSTRTAADQQLAKLIVVSDGLYYVGDTFANIGSMVLATQVLGDINFETDPVAWLATEGVGVGAVALGNDFQVASFILGMVAEKDYTG